MMARNGGELNITPEPLRRLRRVKMKAIQAKAAKELLKTSAENIEETGKENGKEVVKEIGKETVKENVRETVKEYGKNGKSFRIWQLILK